MTKQERNELPILASCKKIELLAPLNWLALGWQDCKRAPKYSAIYGVVVVIISYFIFQWLGILTVLHWL